MRTRLALLTVAAALAVPATASGDDLEGPRTSRAASELLNLATSRVHRADERCRPRPPRRPRPPALTDADPSASFTNVLSIYRRPATTDEIELTTDRDSALGLELPGVEEVYRRGTRVVHSPAGDRFTIRIASRVRVHQPFDPVIRERCDRAIRARLDDFDRPRGVVREARRAFDRGRERAAKLRAETPEVSEGLALSFSPPDRRAAFGTGGVFDLEHFRTHGIWVGGGTRGAGSRFAGLVPDGVAAVTFEFGTRARRTAAVRHNVVSLRMPRGVRRPFPTRMVWRGADGRLIRVVRTGV